MDHYDLAFRCYNAERALAVIADKRCLNATVANPNGSCDWPCVVCIARRTLEPQRKGGKV
jgi:hypothetical protein